MTGGTVSYALTYNGNGSTSGSVPTDANSPYVSGSVVTVVANTGSLARTGYSWTGWNTAADGSGTSYVAGNQFNIAGNTVLYANWTSLPTYRVTYVNNCTGSTGSVADTTAYLAGATVTVQSGAGLSCSGKTFSSWNTSSAGTGTSYAAGSTFSMPGADLTLYGVWANPRYRISYSSNSATSGSAPTDANDYASGTSVTLASTSSLTKTGYSISGWATGSDGTGTAYTSDQVISMPANNLALNANWFAATPSPISTSGTGPWTYNLPSITGISYEYRQCTSTTATSATSSCTTFSGYTALSGNSLAFTQSSFTGQIKLICTQFRAKSATYNTSTPSSATSSYCQYVSGNGSNAVYTKN